MGFAALPAMPRLLGYAQVSTAEQHLDLQRDALERAGCERIFANTASGALDDPAPAGECGSRLARL